MIGKSVLKSVILPAVIFIAGFGVLYPLSSFIENSRPALADGFGDTDLNMNGSQLKGFVFGMDGLIADWYYVRSLQYIGEKIINYEGDINLDDLRNLNPRLLYPLLENATDLDPHFVAAYNYGAVVLPAIDPDKAIQLGAKGVVNNPEQWRLHQQLGYIYWRTGNYEKAAETFEKGAAIKGSSPFMKLMAAAMKTEGGSRETSRAIYQEMLSSDDPQVKITAERRLGQLDSFDEREAIDAALSEYQRVYGKCVERVSQILPLLMRVKLPNGRDFRLDNANRLLDPGGTPYLLDQTACKAALDVEKTGLPVR